MSVLDDISLEDIPKVLPMLSAPEQQQLLAELEKLAILKQKKQAQNEFIPFVKKVWPEFIAGRHHYKMADAFERVARGELKRLIICMPPRHCLELDTPLLTTDGWKTMGSVATGDYVYGPDGQPTRVIGKSEVYRGQELYKITTNDGAHVVTDGGHKWLVRLNRKNGPYKEYTTKQLWERQNGAYLRTKTSGNIELRAGVCNPDTLRLPRLPEISPVQRPEVDLPIDPYILGLWLGDGSAQHATITAHDADAEFYRAEFKRRGYKTSDRATHFTFGVLGIQTSLREMNLINNKHIPETYMLASVEQRRDLVRGLMDSDGNVSAAGQNFFTQKNESFIKQFRELLWSLGIRNTVCATEAKIGEKAYGLAYKVSFYADDLSLLPRKKGRMKRSTRFGRYIKIEKLDRVGDVQCIEVARSDHLFLAGKGMVCTMNSKSEFASHLLPAWFLGKFPHKKIIQTSHTAELAVGFGRKVRNTVDTPEYKDVFPDVELSVDSKAAGRWNTSKRGEYFAIGVGGAVTGKGADIFIIDDPSSEQEAALAESNPDVYDKVYEWYTSGPRQRLQPGGAIVIVMTRWSKRDLVGQVLKAAAQRGGEDWEVIEFPAILPSGNPLWPEFWSYKELDALRTELPNSKWMAQYQQDPISEGAAIIKREWWKLWEKEDPPPCDFVLQAWDTAFEKTQRADYSACTTWGVFYQENEDTGGMEANIILLNAFKDRMEFPTLKRKAIDEYREWAPDSVIIEKKASGSPLIYELRTMGIPVMEYTPVRGNDKISRLNSIADIFASGKVWAPNTRWAEEVIDEVGEFPAAMNDDLTDTVSMAIMRFRQGGYISTLLDEEEPIQYFKSKRRKGYY